MEMTDEEFLAQFAALSSDDGQNLNPIQLPQQVVRTKDWTKCMLMRVISQRVVKEDFFSDDMRKAWVPHPDTVIEAAGNNFFIIEFKVHTDMQRVLEKGIWSYKGDMVVGRQVYSQEEIMDPTVNQMECWVELHGVPPYTLQEAGVQMLAEQIGAPLSEMKSMFYGGQKVHRQKMSVNINEALKDQLRVQLGSMGSVRVHVVYEGVKGICMFCGIIGHDNMQCPMRLRALRMRNNERYRERIGPQVPERMIGKWINNRAYVPREQLGLENSEVSRPSETGAQQGLGHTNKAESSAGSRSVQPNERPKLRSLKRGVDLNENTGQLVILEDQRTEEGHNGEDNRTKHLNYKRAKETIPNSSPRDQ